MKILRLPDRISALIFDLDNTLYTNPAYTRHQTLILEERLALHLGTDLPGARAELAKLVAERTRAGLGPTSMANLSAALGVDIATSVQWREEGILPAEWLTPDPVLAGVLARLASRFPLALVTNNPRSVGLASLAALSVGSLFSVVVGLDDTLRSKPDPAPFVFAAERLGGLPEGSVRHPYSGGQDGDCKDFSGLVSIGDRHDIDLAPALGLGMGAVLIEAVSDVYGLPDILS